MGLSYPSDPHLRRWMSFVDGENLTIRAEKLAIKRGVSFAEGSRYEPNTFIWFPSCPARRNIFPDPPLKLQSNAIRGYYYASVVGDDDRLDSVRESLWSLGFQPEIFKKSAKNEKSKGVDLALARDILGNAFRDNYDVAVLYAGDGDYVPIVEEVKRLGKAVYLSFFYQGGLNAKLRLASDESFDIEEAFFKQWFDYKPE